MRQTFLTASGQGNRLKPIINQYLALGSKIITANVPIGPFVKINHYINLLKFYKAT